MKPADRDAIVSTARILAARIQSNDASSIKAQTVPEYAKDFAAMATLIGNTAPKVKDAAFLVDQIYILDATSLKTAADGTNQDAQFFCSLNKSMAEANFLIPSLPVGRYSFATVATEGAKAPWRLSFLLRQGADTNGVSGQNGNWQIAGFYPKPLTAAGHDGLWYWTHARELASQSRRWSAYLYYQQSENLLQPVEFLTSTHFDKLRKEATASAPPALSEGVSAEAPLVIKAAGGAEYRFSELTTDDSLGADKVDLVVHLQPEPVPDPPASGDAPGRPKVVPASPRDRNSMAMAALLSSYPELRQDFHGVWVFAESRGHSPFVTEEPMANIH